MSTVRVTVDADTCVGIGACDEQDPDAVVLADGAATVARPGMFLDPDRAEALCRSCPAGAITVDTAT